MNESLPKISAAEWEVMSLLWEQAPRTAADVSQVLGPANTWSERTVKTLLARLVKKGALTATPDGKRYLYQPAVSQADCVRRETQTFLDRVFGGAASPLLAHFVKEGELGPDQLAELRKLLDQTTDAKDQAAKSNDEAKS